MSAMPLYMAVDAGGTTTACLLADNDTVLARHTVGTLKLIRGTEAQASANLDRLLESIASQSDANLMHVKATCIGLAGIGMPQFAAWIRENFAARVGGKLELVGDEEIALDAAFRGGRGVLVLAGTGSNVIARSADGATTSVGGWGPAIGDEGSGNWIGSQALRVAFRAHDTGESTSLLRRIAQHWHLARIEDIVAEANRVPGPDFAALTPVVVSCAEEGDAVATRVLVSAGRELAVAATVAIRKLHELEPNVPPPTVAFSGSILQHIAPVRQAMIEFLHAEFPALVISTRPVDPLDGALWRARKIAANRHPEIS